MKEKNIIAPTENDLEGHNSVPIEMGTIKPIRVPISREKLSPKKLKFYFDKEYILRRYSINVIIIISPTELFTGFSSNYY